MQNDAVLKNQLNSKSQYLSTVMVDLLNSSIQDGFQYSIFRTNEILSQSSKLFDKYKNSADVIKLINQLSICQGSDSKDYDPFHNKYKRLPYSSIMTCDFKLDNKITLFIRSLCTKIVLSSTRTNENNAFFGKALRIIRKAVVSEESLITDHILTKNSFSDESLKKLLIKLSKSPFEKLLSQYLNLVEDKFVDEIEALFITNTDRLTNSEMTENKEEQKL